MESKRVKNIENAGNPSPSPTTTTKRRPRKKLEDQTTIEKGATKPARKKRKTTSEDTTNPTSVHENKESDGSIQDKSTTQETANTKTEEVAPRRGWWNRLIQ
jgi:hypothetical protein